MRSGTIKKRESIVPETIKKRLETRKLPGLVRLSQTSKKNEPYDYMAFVAKMKTAIIPDYFQSYRTHFLSTMVLEIGIQVS